MLHSSQSAPVVDGKVMEFVIFAIESAAQKLGIPAPTLYNRLEKLNLIRQYLISVSTHCMALVYPISQFYLCTELKILFLWTLLIVF